MAVHIHRSERTDALLRGLAGLLAQTPADPFTPDLVAVPTPGIERFITQGLGLVLGTSEGRTDGVCANVDFPSPAAVVNRVISQASGIEPQEDPWLPQRAVWPLLAVIDRSREEAWCAPLARHLGLLDDDPLRRNRRFAVASRLVGLFAAYGMQRPSLITDWASGRDSDGAGEPVPEDLAWQPELWRALRDEIGVPSLAERLRPACDAVCDAPDLVDLPPRLSVFGASRLPVGHLQVLSALGQRREVHLWMADASPRPVTGTTGRRREASHHTRNPLLSSLGRDAWELRLRLQALPGVTDEYLPSSIGGQTLLGQLQCQIRDDVPPAKFAADSTMQVHACHGPARQAEVVHEVVLALLQADPTLEPRDILIMCPDLDMFAPLLSAAFCDSSLRLRIADRTPEQGNAVLAGLASLLDMVTGRLKLSALLDFAGQPPVRTKFGFDDDDLERLADLTEQAAIRWGLDERNRADYSLRVASGTWAWGVERLLLGVAMSEDGLAVVNGVLPVDDVNSGDVALVGRLAELVVRLQQTRDALQGAKPPDEWVRVIGTALEDLMEVRGLDAWQLPNALAVVSGLAEDAAGADVPLSLQDLRWLLADLLIGRPTRSNFRSGDLTVCGLAPMRSVPHRVICLVGMDDGAFPRRSIPDGDDVLARDPLVGERDVRSEDRQVLLDAIMAASDTLVITYSGADERSNHRLPPCVPLGDLLDTLATMTGTDIVVHHPLQPFDQRNFVAGALGSPLPFSHDEAALQAARRGEQPRTPAPGLLLPDLPDLPLSTLTPQDLGAFLASPPKAYLRARLALVMRTDDELAPEEIPVELTGLQKWQVGNRSLRLLTRGEPADRVAAAEWARGELPPGALGEDILKPAGLQAQQIAESFAQLRTGSARHVWVDLTLSPGLRMIGGVRDVYDTGIVRASYSKAKPAHEVRLWAELLALAAARPDRRWTACWVAQGGGFRLTAPPDPESVLRELAELYRAGMRAPLPLMPDIACTYTRRRAEGKDAEQAFRFVQFRVWARAFSEREDKDVEALWGEKSDLTGLTAEPPRAEENWYDEPTRFGMLARRVWVPLLASREDL